jgi:hypothetical protein
MASKDKNGRTVIEKFDDDEALSDIYEEDGEASDSVDHD